MGSWTHYRILVKKNFITLKRNYGFAICFILLPLMTMGIFASLLSLVADGDVSEGHNFQNMWWSTTRILDPESPITFSDTNVGSNKLTSLLNCKYADLTNYAIIGDEDIINSYFTKAMFILKQMGFNATIDTHDHVYSRVQNDKEDSFCFSLEIKNFDLENDVYDLSIGWLRNNLPDTNRDPYDLQIRTPDFLNFNKYMKNGFMGIYQIIVMSILDAKNIDANMDIAYLPMKTPSYYKIDPQIIEQLQLIFPFFLMFTFLIPLYYIVSKLAEEKESKSREGMKMMGLKDSTYYLSWMTTFGVVIALMSVLVVIMSFFETYRQSNMFLLFILCFLYGLSLFGFSIMIVAALPTQRSSSLAASLLHVVTYFIVYAIASPDISASIKYGLSIFPNVGMALAVLNLFHFEYQATGLNFTNSNTAYGQVTFTGMLLMLTFDVFFYLLFGLYLDQIIPSQYGVAKKWYFVCTKSFCCGRKRRNVAQNEDQQNLIDDDEEAKNPNDFEQVPQNIKRQEQTNECLKIRGLRKAFGNKMAVDNTNMTMYQGQIFALLGHNGAGKTTTISMLTGLFEPTQGKASVYGIDIFEDMEEMRKILGVCPQHDVLFEYLTPREHLQLFAAFKGTPINEIPDQIDKMIKDIDLVSVQNQIAKTLSGGQKRKLSVGCSMIGNSKVVILDEPTSGMDTTSRRRLWEMLKSNKSGKIIILTTHYMDEADILGDRIGIMAEGKVKCIGSSLFLKNRFGVGYNLVIAKKSRDPAPQVDEFIFSRIEGVKKLQEVSSEMNFQLPTGSSSQFKDFFTEFDNNLDTLGIRSYGVGITTLEEVFLRIGRGQDEEDEAEREEMRKFTLEKYDPKNNVLKGSSIQHALDGTDDASAKKNELEEYSIAEEHETDKLKVFWLNLSALLKKKWLLQIRDPKTFVIEIFFPIVFIFVGLALSSITLFREGHPRQLSPTIFPSPNQLYYNTPSGKNQATTKLVQDYFSYNASEWSDPTPIAINPNTDFQTMVSTLDDFIYSSANAQGRSVFGDYFYYDLNSKNNGNYAVVALINITSQDAVACYGNAIHETLLKQILNNPNLRLNVNLDPFPITALENGVMSAAAGTSSCILFAIAYMMVANSLIANIIKERQRNVKHQMIISGVSIPAYWLSHYLVDIVFQAPPSICIVIGIQLFGLDMPDTWLIVLIFVFANPVFVYFFSFLFDNEGTASILTRLIYLLTGSIFPIAVSLLLVIPSTANTGKVLRWFFYILPVFSLNFGVVNISNRKVVALATGSNELEPLDWLVGGPSVVFMAIDIFVYWFLIFLFEKDFFAYCRDQIFCRRRHQDDIKNSMAQDANEDEDVVEEENRVALSDPQGQTVKIQQVKKLYGKSMAVDKVSFGLEYGECFALLGVSGAGKTTTFKCLTGEEKPTVGQVYVNGHDVTSQQGFDQARRLIGYCPQFDAIFDGMTVKEHLEFYAKVKGVVDRFRVPLVEKQMQEMDLKEFENVRAEKLSGGNKRKLSVAMAMIGNPPIVFLDEPSTGVDPKAKRFMWSIVSKISTMRKKSSVIITTHSMEEAEALCTKMGIMVAGRFKCFGSAQHIKTKFGTGYEIEIKIRTLKEDEINAIKQQIGIEDQPIGFNQLETVLTGMQCQHLANEIKENGLGHEFHKELQAIGSIRLDELIRWAFTESKAMLVLEKFEGMFQSVELLEHYNNSYLVKVSRDSFSIGYLFGMMEDIKQDFEISEYSVSQTTLEQIFNNFAKEAEKGNPRRRTTMTRRTTKKQVTAEGDADRLKTVALDKSSDAFN